MSNIFYIDDIDASIIVGEMKIKVERQTETEPELQNQTSLIIPYHDIYKENGPSSPRTASLNTSPSMLMKQRPSRNIQHKNNAAFTENISSFLTSMRQYQREDNHNDVTAVPALNNNAVRSSNRSKAVSTSYEQEEDWFTSYINRTSSEM